MLFRSEYDITKPEKYIPPILQYEKHLSLRDIEYQNKYSFPGLVASYYNKQYFKRLKNGGTNYDIFTLLKMLEYFVDAQSIDCIFLQPTDPLRYSSSPLIGNSNELHNFHHDIYFKIKNKEINEIVGYPILAKKQYELFETHLEFLYKRANIPSYYIPWQTCFSDIIPKEKMIPLNYNDKVYWSMESLMKKDKLTISDDLEFCLDMHISKNCHKIIADSIIKCFPNGDFTKRIYIPNINKNII